MSMPSPQEMMRILHLADTEIELAFRYASLDMLKQVYERHSTHKAVNKARANLERAIAEWTDEQIVDFLVKHIFQPPQSTQLQSKSVTELRCLLSEIYCYLFCREELP